LIDNQSISIAMATYNGASYLEAQLESFASQRLLPNELIVCDDGSSDGTTSIVESFAVRVNFPVKLKRNQERLGYNCNFAKAIGLCSGDLIFVSDQDDEWHSDKLAIMSAVFSANPEILAATNDQRIVLADGTATGSTVLQNVRRLGYSDLHYGPGCCTGFRRQLLDIADPFPGDAVPYDHWINIIPALLGVRIVHAEPLQSYRRHGSNTSGSTFALERPSLATLATRRDSVGVRDAFRERINSLDLIVARLAERRSIIARRGLDQSYEFAQRELQKERAGYAARLSCLERSRSRRVPAVLKLLQDGTYNQFQGYKSALKDLLS
jgi:glycosyltransferase involved in cell wall biosynthesis